MDDKELEDKVVEFLNSLKPEEMVCFTCKRPAHTVYVPDDFSWGPYLVCEKCQTNFDQLVNFSKDDCAPGVH